MGVPMALLHCFAADGASVITGADNGVAIRLRTSANVFMLLVHCVAHRHAPASKDATDGSDVAEFYGPGLNDILIILQVAGALRPP